MNNTMINNISVNAVANEAVETRKPEFKYSNYFAGFKFVVSIDGEEHTWCVSNNVKEWAYSYSWMDKISTTDKDLKKFHLENINAFVENVYYKLVAARILRNKNAVAATTKEERVKIVREATCAVRHLWRALGVIPANREWIWETEFTCLEEMIATRVGTKTAWDEGRRMDVTALKDFKASFWNMLFKIAWNEDILVKSANFDEKNVASDEKLAKKAAAEAKRRAAEEKKAASAQKKAEKAASGKKSSSKKTKAELEAELEALKARLEAMEQTAEQTDAE